MTTKPEQTTMNNQSTPAINAVVDKPKLYIASKTKHASKWVRLREDGLNIISTWIDEAGMGQTKDMADLCRRCIKESNDCDMMIVYAEEGDYLKGAFIEMGVALTHPEKPIYLVGEVLPMGSAFTYFQNVHKANSIEDAILQYKPSEVNAVVREDGEWVKALNLKTPDELDSNICVGDTIKIYGEQTKVLGFYGAFNEGLMKWETIILTEGRGDPFERSLNKIEVLTPTEGPFTKSKRNGTYPPQPPSPIDKQEGGKNHLIKLIEGFSDFYSSYKEKDPPEGITTIIGKYVDTLNDRMFFLKEMLSAHTAGVISGNKQAMGKDFKTQEQWFLNNHNIKI